MRVVILSSVHDALDNRVFYREALSLKNAGYDVHLVARYPGDTEKQGIIIHGIPTVRRWLRPLLWIQLIIKAIKLKPDICHYHDPELLLVAPFLKLLTGNPTIYDVHEVYPEFFLVKDYLPGFLRILFSKLARWFEPMLAGLNNGLVFADNEIAKQFGKINLPEATLFNYSSLDFINRVPDEKKITRSENPTVLYLGGLERNRGAELMVDAFSLVQNTRPDAKLIIVGHFMPPNLADEFREHCRKKKVESSVEIVGRVPFEDIGDYLESAWIGWIPWQSFPKNEKNIPTKLFEYMAYRLPIVSSDLDSTRQFIEDEKNGLLVQPDDPVDHANAILALMEQQDLRTSMGKNNRALVVEKYNWDMMQLLLVNLYKEVLRIDQ